MKGMQMVEETLTHLLEIYIARHCFGSKEALTLAVEAKRRLPDIAVDVKVLDDMTPAGTSIFATPCYYLDGRLIFLGNPRIGDLVSRVESTPAVQNGGNDHE